MVSSSAYPDLDRSPKKNWVESAGGLPSYIERIAKHIHYEGGKDISTAISMAISQVKKWAAGIGNVSAKTRALAAKAIAEWEKLKATNAAKKAVKLSARRIEAEVLELALVTGVDGRVRAADTVGELRKAHVSGVVREIARLRAKVTAGTATAADRAKLKKLREGREKKVATELGAKRGPYTRHVQHTQQFGKAKGNLSKPASWQHPYQPKNQLAGALKAKHLKKSDLDSTGHPKAGKADDVKQPLPASAAIAGTGRKEQHTGAEAHRKAAAPTGPKQVKKAPSAAVLRAQRRRLQAKVDSKTATPAERKQLNQVIAALKTTSRS